MSSDLQIVVNLKGVFMGKLKEKLKPEKLSATFPAYIIAYFYVHDDWLLYDHVFFVSLCIRLVY